MQKVEAMNSAAAWFFVGASMKALIKPVRGSSTPGSEKCDFSISSYFQSLTATSIGGASLCRRQHRFRTEPTYG
jgi:hypothetical protein